MDRRGFLLLGAAGVSAGVSSWYPPIEPSGGVVGRTSDASGLLSLAELDEREEPYFDPDPTTVTGTGDDTVEFESQGGFTMVQAVADGEFRITTADRRLTAGESGRIVTGYPMTAATHTLSISASAEWELTLAQPQSPTEEIREPPARAVGSGDVIVGPLDTSEDTVVSADHEGAGAFEVSLALEASPGVFDPETLFETTGTVEEEATTRMAGVAWVVVTASDSWTLDFEHRT
jgi:hypothetical protein